jgi:hypothetical protein
LQGSRPVKVDLRRFIVLRQTDKYCPYKFDFGGLSRLKNTSAGFPES